MALFIRSDDHWGHEKIARVRGFPDAAEHDEWLRRMWRKDIHPGDRVISLGDISSGGRDAQLRALEIMDELPGELEAIYLGNHDGAHPLHGVGSVQRWQPLYMQVFKAVMTNGKVKYEGLTVLASHFPYRADHTAEPRHMDWRPADLGKPLVHGHIHSEEVWTSPTEMHLGLDAWKLRSAPAGVVAKMWRDCLEGEALEAATRGDKHRVEQLDRALAGDESPRRVAASSSADKPVRGSSPAL